MDEKNEKDAKKHTQSGERQRQKTPATNGEGFPRLGDRLLNAIGSDTGVHPSVRD